MTRKVAIIGGGVIGGGWAARFLLNGWNVSVFDPDRQAERKIAEVLANARASLPALSDIPMGAEGKLSFAQTITEAVEGADYIQESVSERLDLKHRVFAQIQQSAELGTPIGSSTSGFKPSELQEGAANPSVIFVAHPFNPVYLLPLAEVVPSPRSDAKVIEAAKTILREIGMFPLHVRKEIDAHIADRFLEAVWREALWLVKDGIATTEEIDEASPTLSARKTSAATRSWRSVMKPPALPWRACSKARCLFLKSMKTGSYSGLVTCVRFSGPPRLVRPRNTRAPSSMYFL